MEDLGGLRFQLDDGSSEEKLLEFVIESSYAGPRRTTKIAEKLKQPPPEFALGKMKLLQTYSSTVNMP